MTSIEWLIEEMLSKGFFKESVTLTNIDHLQYKAEEMHKQEIIDAHNKSWETRDNPYKTAEKYYQETFVSKGSDDHISDISKMVEVPQQENLYTEEQVREAIEIAFKHWLHYSSCNVEEIIKSLKQPKKD